jgi:hypothetical protein
MTRGRVKKTPQESEALFWSRVDKRGPDECWPWLGAPNNRHGYGGFWFDGKSELAHRLAYRLTFGQITDGFWILHSCDNPPCCNPAHLREGTVVDNNRDRTERGRWKGNMVPPLAILKRAQTHCKRGHEFTPENTRIDLTQGTRKCRICMHERSWRWRHGNDDVTRDRDPACVR